MATCYSFASSGASHANLTQGACSHFTRSACCKVGDICYSSGFCYSYDFGSYYLGGCTDDTGSNSLSCPGRCPDSKPLLQWNSALGEWRCCGVNSVSRSDSLDTCESPANNDGTSTQIVLEMEPSELEATASIVDSTSFSAVSQYTSPPDYDPYSNTLDYYYPTSSYNRYSYTSAPTSTFTGEPESSAGHPGTFAPGIIVVLVILPILGALLMAALVFIMIRACRKQQKRYLNPTGMPVGQQVNQFVNASYNPEQAKDLYDRKMTAMSWLAQQPPQALQVHEGQNGWFIQPNPAVATVPTGGGVLASAPNQQPVGSPVAPSNPPPPVPLGATGGPRSPPPTLPPIAEVGNIEQPSLESARSQPEAEQGSATQPQPQLQPPQPAVSPVSIRSSSEQTASRPDWPLTASAPVSEIEESVVGTTSAPVEEESRPSAVSHGARPGSSGQEVAAAAVPETTGEQPGRGSEEARRHHDDFYA